MAHRDRRDKMRATEFARRARKKGFATGFAGAAESDASAASDAEVRAAH